MKPSLDGVELKLSSADENLTFLANERDRFLGEAGAHPTVGNVNLKTSEYVFRVRDLPPPEWGIRVSEFAHHLRSSLDNLLWQVILARKGTPVPFVTQFPIWETKAQFQGKAYLSTKGVKDEDFTFLRNAQPYKDGPKLAPWNPLSLLKHLNNIDKHRFVHPSFVGTAVTTVTTGGRVRPVLLCSRRLGLGKKPSDPLVSVGMPIPFVQNDYRDLKEMSFGVNEDDPAEIVRFVFSKVSINTKVDMNPSPTIDISFSDGERPMTIDDLIDIRDAVKGVVDHFRPLFG